MKGVIMAIEDMISFGMNINFIDSQVFKDQICLIIINQRASQLAQMQELTKSFRS
jgi:hypothetical protein